MSDASAESSAAATDTIQVHDIADRAIVAAIAPAGVVIDDQLTILEFRGRVSSFFGPSPGVANLDLLHMAREELRLELQRAIDDARLAGEPVRRVGVVAFHDDAGRTIDLRVIPFFVSPPNGRFFAVLFEDSASAVAGRDATMRPLSQPAIEGELRRELASMRKYLRSVIERHEANNEELRILSEQLIVSNEELHSTNEELRTAKEDLEASNEELRTTNDEMIVRSAASMCLADDLANVLDSVAIAIVILGRDLRIRRFTPTAARLLGLVEADIGRPIGDTRLKLHAPDLPKAIEEVLVRSTPDERTVQDQHGCWYRLTVRPYVTADRRVDGIVLSVFDDTTVRQQSERRILEYQEKLQNMAFDATVAEERERRRIAVDLHDRIGQALAAARMKMTSAHERTTGEARNAIQQALDLVAQTIADTRTLMFDLSPPVLYDLGLREALSWLAEEVEGRHGVHVEIIEYGTLPQLDETAAVTLFRSVRELLMNVVKHSDARQVHVTLRTEPERYEIEVRDSGRGFDPDAATRPSGSGFGLFSVREQMSRLRGTLAIAAAPTQGTRVTLSVPIDIAMGPEAPKDNGR